MPRAFDFFYFSGTGNTLLVAKQMQEVLVKRGATIRMRRMEKSNPREINLENEIVFAFPVAILATYPIVWTFIKGKPEAQGTRVYMVDTLGGLSIGLVGGLKRVLMKKGYSPEGAEEIQMPINFFRSNSNENKKETMIEMGLEKAEKYADEIYEGRTTWRRLPFLSDLAHHFFTSRLLWNIVPIWPKMHVDKTRCTKCSECVDLCPIGNIIMDDYPRH